jgi:hypothetical protein
MTFKPRDVELRRWPPVAPIATLAGAHKIPPLNTKENLSLRSHHKRLLYRRPAAQGHVVPTAILLAIEAKPGQEFH